MHRKLYQTWLGRIILGFAIALPAQALVVLNIETWAVAHGYDRLYQGAIGSMIQALGSPLVLGFLLGGVVFGVPWDRMWAKLRHPKAETPRQSISPNVARLLGDVAALSLSLAQEGTFYSGDVETKRAIHVLKLSQRFVFYNPVARDLLKQMILAAERVIGPDGTPVTYDQDIKLIAATPELLASAVGMNLTPTAAQSDTR